MIVKFISGPLDGQLREISDGSNLRIERPLNEAGVCDPSNPIPIEVGVYIRGTGAFRNRMYWQGWR